MTQNWIEEAKNIKSEKDFSMDLLYQTNDISDFLERRDITSISATKGFGKTFALKIKSINYRSTMNGVTFIPKNELVDKFIPQNKPPISQEIKKQFLDITKHTALWEMSFLISIIANTELLENVKDIYDKYPLLRELFESNSSKSLQLTYCHLLDNYSQFNEFIFKSNGMRRELVSTLGLLSHGVHMFLDNIDEFYLEEENFSIHEGDLWFVAQIALIKCVYQIDQITSHLHIYYTTRKRVLDRLQDKDVMYTQYMSSISEIKYAKHELKKIFINNIRNEKEGRLVFPDQIKEKPFLSFMGTEEIQNISQIKDTKEDVFDYIYRHTFGRPRDLMVLGKSISHLSKESRIIIESLREKINKKSYGIGKQYIKELKYFVDINFDMLFQLISKNILSEEEVKEICCKYNGLDPSFQCDKCKNNLNVFSMLYLQGLIGIEKYNQFNNSWHQRFITTGQQYVNGDIDILPKSERYFVHPCFTEVIKEYRKKHELSEFSPNRNLIVGNSIEIFKKKDKTIISNIHVHFGAGRLGY